MDMEMKQSRFKRICVFCGSSPGKKSSYKDAAIELGKELVINKNKICLSVLAPVSFLQFNLFFFFFFSLLSEAFFSGFLGFVSWLLPLHTYNLPLVLVFHSESYDCVRLLIIASVLHCFYGFLRISNPSLMNAYHHFLCFIFHKTQFVSLSYITHPRWYMICWTKNLTSFFFFSKVSRNIDLVYGGGSIGLMGLISQAVFDGGRHVIG